MIWTYPSHVNITPTPNQHQKQWRFTFQYFFGKSGRMKDTYFDHHLFALLAAVDLEQKLLLGKNRWVGFLQHFRIICWDCHPPGTTILLVKTGGFNGRFWCSLAAGSWCLKSPEKQLVVFAACTETTQTPGESWNVISSFGGCRYSREFHTISLMKAFPQQPRTVTAATAPWLKNGSFPVGSPRRNCCCKGDAEHRLGENRLAGRFWYWRAHFKNPRILHQPDDSCLSITNHGLIPGNFPAAETLFRIKGTEIPSIETITRFENSNSWQIHWSVSSPSPAHHLPSSHFSQPAPANASPPWQWCGKQVGAPKKTWDKWVPGNWTDF